jgi:hypothetical protein
MPFHQNHCTGPQIANFYAYCIGPNSNTTQCNNFVTANSACEQCIETAPSSPTYGPLVILPNGVAEINIAGCIYNANAAHQTCAQAYQAAIQCENQACESPCTGKPIDSFLNCETASSTGGCAAFVAQAGCTNSFSNLDPDYGCFSGPDFLTNYTTVATAFCGP